MKRGYGYGVGFDAKRREYLIYSPQAKIVHRSLSDKFEDYEKTIDLANFLDLMAGSPNLTEAL